MKTTQPGAKPTTPATALAIAALLLAEAAGAATLTRLVVSPTSRDLRLGSTIAVRALAEYDDGTFGVDVTDQVTWASTVPTVATVAGGVVTTAGPGATTVVAIDPGTGTESDPSTGNLRVVEHLSAISLTPKTQILPVRRRTRFRAWGDFEDGVVLNLVGNASFSVSDPSVAAITETGLARGLTPGETVVSAFDVVTGISSADSGNDVVLTVVGDLQELSLEPERIALSVGDRTDLEARGLFEGNCKWLDFGSRLRWASSDDAVVSVSRDGEIECLQEGTAIVSIRDRRVSSAETERDTEVVCGGDVVAIEVTPESFVLPVGEKRGLEATYVFADGSRANGTRSVYWTSSDPAVFQITKANGRDEGEGKAIAPGQAALVATDPARGISSADAGGRNGSIDVPSELVDLQLRSIPYAPPPLFGEPGGIVRIDAVAIFDGGLVRAVKKLAAWSSSDESIVSIPDGSTCPQTGQIDLLSEGIATITVTYPKAGGPGSITRTIDIVVEYPGSSASRAFLLPSGGLF